jgi:hypothetical protein
VDPFQEKIIAKNTYQRHLGNFGNKGKFDLDNLKQSEDWSGFKKSLLNSSHFPHGRGYKRLDAALKPPVGPRQSSVGDSVE